jgi:hypothetical protein
MPQPTLSHTKCRRLDELWSKLCCTTCLTLPLLAGSRDVTVASHPLPLPSFSLQPFLLFFATHAVESLVGSEHLVRNLIGCIVQSDSVARDPKLLSIKNYVIEIMTSKFIYTYRQRWKQNLLIIDVETGILSHPSTLKCEYNFYRQ